MRRGRAGIEPNYVWSLASREATKTLAILGIPELHLPIVRSRKECLAGGMEIGIGDRLRMPRKRPQQLPRVIHIPKFGLPIRRRRQQQMPGIGEES